jgi:hypothetical protein
MMAIIKSTKSAAAPAAAAKKSAGKKAASKPEVKSEAPADKKPTTSWYKRGDAVKKAVEDEDRRAEERKQEQGKLWRFWMKQDEEGASVTFIDGYLTKAGVLDGFSFREHTEKMGNDYHNYVCVSENEPCPICALGKDHNYSLVTVFTVIDHREYKGKKASYKDTPKLFVAKKETFKLLQGIASKRGGLAGCTFDIMRTGEKSANVGNHFDFTEKQPIEVLRKKYMKKDAKGKVSTIFLPADYTTEITYRTAAELRKLGFGKTPIGGEGSLPDGEAAGEDAGSQM